MNIHEALETSRDIAHQMLVEQFDTERGIPMRAPSHTDLWPGDRWPEAYLAAGEPELAQAAIDSIGRSVQPDGSIPHLMQGSHKRAGLETRWIDRQVYRMQGNGAMRLPNGEWVTRSFAAPTQALGVLAIHKAGLEVPSSLNVTGLKTAALRLYERRSTGDALIGARTADELTRSTGELSQQLKTIPGMVADPAVNALLVNNNRALKSYAESLGDAWSPALDLVAANTGRTERGLHGQLNYEVQMSQIPELTLAMARVPDLSPALTDEKLAEFYAAPDPKNPHPEKQHLTMAETIEVARLTPWSEASHDYLERILPMIAQMGAGAMTRYEGIGPGKNAVANKYNRKHLWLPTAAEIVQIDASTL